MNEGDLRELARWFSSTGGRRRRLLQRYRTGRQKTAALESRRQAGGDMFAAVRGIKLPTRAGGGGGTKPSPSSDAVSCIG